MKSCVNISKVRLGWVGFGSWHMNLKGRDSFVMFEKSKSKAILQIYITLQGALSHYNCSRERMNRRTAGYKDGVVTLYI